MLWTYAFQVNSEEISHGELEMKHCKQVGID